MFEKGEFVYHESGGICQVTDVLKAPLSGMPADRLYYVLNPIHDRSSTIYLPVDCDSIFVRRLLGAEEAKQLIDEIPDIPKIGETNSKLLRAAYLDAMRSHAPKNWVRVIKTVYQRSVQNTRPSQRLSETERSFSENAKRNLYAELALALGMQETDVETYLIDHLEKRA